MIFIDAAKNTLKMSCANFHKNLIGRVEMANISKLVRFLINLIYLIWFLCKSRLNTCDRTLDTLYIIFKLLPSKLQSNHYYSWHYLLTYYLLPVKKKNVLLFRLRLQEVQYASKHWNLFNTQCQRTRTIAQWQLQIIIMFNVLSIDGT